jgi:sarcosine oxidase
MQPQLLTSATTDKRRIARRGSEALLLVLAIGAVTAPDRRATDWEPRTRDHGVAVTATDFDDIVIGRGLMGAAAGRHLATAGERVALVGPDEPADRTTHSGIFASHYDEGRITRILDPDPIWAQLAQRSLRRYRDIEARSGVRFYHEAGHLMVLSERERAAQVERVARQLDVEFETLAAADIAERFDYLTFEPDVVGFHQPHTAGHVSPRAQVHAQVVAARRHGATVLPAVVRGVRDHTDHVAVTLADGARLRCGRALVATGGFSNVDGLLPHPLDLTVYARTVVLVELMAADVERLRHMPSVISRPRDSEQRCYLLPPIRYPDGRWYLKIGGHSDDRPLRSLAELQEWFRGDGDARVARQLIDRLHAVVPGLRPAGIRTVPCVTTHTPTGHAYADRLDGGRITVLVGGNGSAAKSADELGRLGALVLRHDAWRYDIPRERFSVRSAPVSGAT